MHHRGIVNARRVCPAHTFDVNTKKVGAAVQPTMYGIFFEDINYAADGGLYGELVKNRSFEFPQALMGWQSFGKVEVKNDGPFERCPHYVVLNYSGHNDAATGLQNEGYFGIGIEKGESYRFTVWAKATGGDAKVEVSLVDQSTMEEHQEFATAELCVSGNEWKKYELTLASPKTVQKANLRLLLKGKNGVALEHVSLFPVNTFKNRENGMRRDLAQALYDLHPGVLRFPGGCIVEGSVDKHKGEVIVKVANTSDKAQNIALNLNGLKGDRSATVTILQCDKMDAENTLDNPNAIRPVETAAKCDSKKNAAVLSDKLPAKSFRMYRIK